MARLVGRKPVETKINALSSGSIPIYNLDLKSWDTIHLSEITGSVFPYTGSAVISGSLIVSGSTNIVGTSGTTLLSTNADTLVFTGSLYTSGSIISTGSLQVNGGITGSLLGTASFASNAGNSISSSYAATASSADDFNVRGTLTAQRIVVQTITSSTEYVTGSTQFGSLLSNTHQFTGSVLVTGSLEVNGRNYINDSSSFASRIATNSSSLATFSGSYINESSSFASRITTNSASFASFSGSYINESSSFASRITTNSASFATFSGSYVIESGSFSNRIAVNSASFATFSGSYINESSSFASRIITNSASISSLSSSFLSFSSSYNSASFTGSFTGDGGGLYNIPAGGIVGLNLSRIASGSATASISPNKGFTVNVNSEITGSLIVTNGITGSLLGTASYAENANLLDGKDSTIFATTGSNIFKGLQTIYGNLFMSGSFPLVYNNDSTNNMLFGMFDGSTIYGPYYQLFGNQYTNVSQRGGAEFVYDIRNNADANFHISSYNGSTWTQKFLVNDTGVQVTGSLGVTGGITGSLLGTSSYAVQALSASYWSGSISNANTASYALNAVSSSYAATASSADDFTVRGTLTAQTIVAQTITSSTEFITGSTKFGSLLSNTHQFTGSVNITGSLNINGENLTGISSSFASRITTNSSSFAAFSGSYVNESSSFASRATTNSASISSLSSSFISFSGSYNTGSFNGYFTGSLFGTSSYALTSSNNILGGANTFVPYWNGDRLIASSITYDGYNTYDVGLSVPRNYYNFIIHAATEPRLFLSSSNNDVLAVYNSYGDVGINYQTNLINNNIIRYQTYNGLNKLTLQTSEIDRISISNSGSIQFNAYAANGLLKTTGSNGTITLATASIDYVIPSTLNDYVLNSVTSSMTVLSSSYSINSTSASYAQTASYVLNAISASFAATASIATSATRASTVSISGISTNAEYSFPLIATGSSGPSIGLNNDTVSGFSYNPSTNLFKIFNIQATGSLLGTASYAAEALTASYAANVPVTASYANNALSSSYAANAELLDGKDSTIFATTGSNTFNGNQIISAGNRLYADSIENYTGNILNLFGDVKFNGNVVEIPNDIAVTGSLIANNITGSLLGTASYALNAITASYALTASSANSFNVRNSLTASGLRYPTTDGGFASQVLQTDATGNLTFGDVQTTFDTVYNGEATTLVKGTPVYVSGSQGANPKVYRADASNASKMPVIYIISENITSGATGRGITLGHIEGIDLTGYNPGTAIYIAEGGGWTSTRPTGSNTIIQFLGLVTKTGAGGKGLILNPGPVVLPNIQSGYTWVGNGSNYPLAVATSSLSVASASFATTSSYPFFVTGSQSSPNSSIVTSLNGRNFAPDVEESVLLGVDAGVGSNEIFQNVIVGKEAGASTTNAAYMALLGYQAGYSASNAQGLVAIGAQAGYAASQSRYNNIIGGFAGNSLVNVEYSTAIGSDSLNSAMSTYGLIAIGNSTGNNSKKNDNTIFIGNSAGSWAVSSSYSAFIGLSAGYGVKNTTSSIFIGNNTGRGPGNVLSNPYYLGRNNIIIGTDITLPVSSSDSINIGGLIFGTGSHYSDAFNPTYFSGSANGKIGINQPLPQYNLDVSGSGNYTNGLTITGSLIVSGSSTILQNLTVLGTASYNSVTASSLIINDNWVTVTTTSSLGRFGGIKILDYEGVGQTASLAWDTTADRWMEIPPVHDTYSSSLFIMGPQNTGSLGSEIGLADYYVPIAIGEHHLYNSKIRNSGSAVSIETSTSITGSLNVTQGITGSLQGTSSYANFALSASHAAFADSVGTIISGSIVTTGSNTFIGNQTISGSLSLTGNLTVLGTSSFTYVTASQLALSASFISVNVFEPAERFGGIKVYDSGSSNATASLAWDSLVNRWVYQNASGSSYGGAILIAGPRNTGSLGDERALTSGRIPKSVGGDHIDDSVMSEVSGSISVSGSLVITGSLGLSQSLYVNQNTSSLASGIQIISTNATSSYNSAFYNYVLSAGSNARAGQFIAVWNGSSINYTDVSTTDIGTTLNVVLTASLSNGNVLLSTVLPSNNWTIKTTVNFL